MFSCQYCEILKNTYFEEHLRTGYFCIFLAYIYKHLLDGLDLFSVAKDFVSLNDVGYNYFEAFAKTDDIFNNLMLLAKISFSASSTAHNGKIDFVVLRTCKNVESASRLNSFCQTPFVLRVLQVLLIVHISFQPSFFS